ncbi:hypothetical protein HDU84_004020, partial [Entophlyctis sp. JEL0112]
MLVVTATGLAPAVRDRVERHCRVFGALFSPSLTNNTTHLVACNPVPDPAVPPSPVSEKHRVSLLPAYYHVRRATPTSFCVSQKVAARLDIPIVSVSWIDACVALVESSRASAPLSESDVSALTLSHSLKPLLSLVVCVSGFDPSVRADIEASSVRLGARFEPDLSKICTHLVVEKGSGRKFDFAVRVGSIKIVNRDWLRECWKRKEHVDESQYKVPCDNSGSQLTPKMQTVLEPPLTGRAKGKQMVLNNDKCIFIDPKSPPTPIVPKPATQTTATKSRSVNPANRQQTPSAQNMIEPRHNRNAISDFQPSRSVRKPVNRKSLAILEQGQTVANLHTRRSQKSSHARRSMVSDAFRRRHDDFASITNASAPASTASPSATVGEGHLPQIFAGMVFSVHAFDVDDTQLLVDAICAFGGRLGNATAESRSWKTIAQVAIWPLGCSDAPESEGKTTVVVSECWIERCVEDSRLYGFEESILFRANIPKRSGSNSDRKYIVGITEVSGLDREQIRKLAEAMGATFTETLSRKNTHLIVHNIDEVDRLISQQNTKLLRAKEWGVVVVGIDWIFKCAEYGQMFWTTQDIPARKEDGASLHSSSKPLIQNSKPLPVDGRNLFEVLSRKESDISTKSHVSEKEFVFDDFGPKHQLVPQQSVTPIAQLPVVSGDKSHTSVSTEGPQPEEDEHIPQVDDLDETQGSPTDEQTKKDFESQLFRDTVVDEFEDLNDVQPLARNADSIMDSEIVDERGNTTVIADDISLKHQTTGSLFAQSEKPVFDLSDAFKTVQSPQPRRHESNLDAILSQSLSKAQANMARSHQKDESNLAPPSFSDVFVCLSERATPYRHDTVHLCKRLGANFLHNFSEACTHYVHVPGTPNDKIGDKDFKRVKTATAGRKLHFVSPVWLQVCFEKGRRVSEEEFPWTVDVRKGLWKDIECGNAVSNDGNSEIASTVLPAKAEAENAVSAKSSAAAKEAADRSISPSSRGSEIVNSRLKPTPGNTSENRAFNMQEVDFSAVEQLVSGNGKLLGSGVGVLEREDETFTQAPKNTSPAAIDPYASFVIYDDPQARTSKRHLLEVVSTSSLKRAKKIPQQDEPEFLNFDHTRENSTRQFVITGIQEDKRGEMRAQIEKLGGIVLKGEDGASGWNRDCTHLLCSRPANTEKCFSACAKGAWILHETYIEKSSEAGRFLDEEEFEWAKFLTSNDSDISQLCSASKKWRVKLANYKSGFQNHPSGAFEHWQVLLVMKSSRRLSGFRRVLEAGCALVVATSIDDMEKDMDK